MNKEPVFKSLETIGIISHKPQTTNHKVGGGGEVRLEEQNQ